MKIAYINPYVRFVRIHKKELRQNAIAAPDHRIFYCVEGEGQIIANGVGYSMKKNSFLLIRAGTPYQGTPASQMELYAINFDMTADASRSIEPLPYYLFEDFSPLLLAEPRENWLEELDGDILYLSEFYQKDQFSLILSEYLSGKVFSKERCAAALKELIILAMRESSLGRLSCKSDAILAYVREHFSEPLTNESVAAHFSYHKNYVNAILKREIGQTLHTYLLHYRISIAVSLLSSGEYGVFETGLRVGFTEPTHFSRAFKKIMGKAPSDYLPKR